MDENGFNAFDDFIRFCRSVSEQEENSDSSKSDNDKAECENCKFGNKNAEASEEQRNAYSDIPGGFQDINPQLFTIVTTIIGTMVAGNLPFNIQNAIGNWLELLGQSIITFNAQQQYFQGGPGRLYSPIYRNAANPFCTNSSDESQSNISSSKSKKSKKTKSSNNEEWNNSVKKKGSINQKTDFTSISDDELQELKDCIRMLNKEVKELKKEIDELKK